MIYDIGGGQTVKNVPVPPSGSRALRAERGRHSQLARWACLIEEHYSAQTRTPTPMDIEWAKDGITGELFIVQARPETVQSRKDANVLELYQLEDRGKVLLTGRSVGAKIASGPVRVIKSTRIARQFQEGEVLVAEKTDPDWEPVMKKAAAIITDRGGRTCHAAIVSRELGVPAIVGTENGTDVLKDGQVVTVSCAGGDTGIVYEGSCRFDVTRTDLKEIGRPRTQIMMNVAIPKKPSRSRSSRTTASAWRARSSSSRATSRCIRSRCSITRRSRTPRCAQRSIELTAGYDRQGAILRR